MSTNTVFEDELENILAVEAGFVRLVDEDGDSAMYTIEKFDAMMDAYLNHKMKQQA